MVAKHQLKSRYFCNICEFSTNWKRIFNSHVWSKHQDKVGRYTCEQCDPKRKFFFKHGLRQHINQVHGKKLTKEEKAQLPKKPNKYFCDQCDKKYKSKNALSEHLAIIHSKTEPSILCASCPKIFITKSQLVSHTLYNHPVKFVKCTFEGCDKSFGTKTQLKLHVTGVHQPVIYSCEYCGKSFTKEQTFKAHVQINHLGLRYRCVFPYCDLIYSGKDKLKRHMKTAHANDCELEENFKMLKNLKPFLAPAGGMSRRGRSETNVQVEYHERNLFE